MRLAVELDPVVPSIRSQIRCIFLAEMVVQLRRLSVNSELPIMLIVETLGRMGDLWRFRLSTRQWTWMSGHSAINGAGVFGTLGQESASNLPGGRSAATMVFHLRTYSLYMFGGGGHASVVNDGILMNLLVRHLMFRTIG